jgi:hypothetical protein
MRHAADTLSHYKRAVRSAAVADLRETHFANAAYGRSQEMPEGATGYRSAADHK